MDPLTGYIEYHLNGECGGISWTAKPDSDEENDISDASLKAGQKRPYSSLEQVETKSGFYFIPCDYNKHEFECGEFRMILPQNLIGVAIRSILRKTAITLTSYKISNFCNTPAIEVFTNGMVGEIQMEKQNLELLSLRDIQKLEEQSLQNETKKKKSTKFTLCARVDSISPIITAEPSDPFALMEIYDVKNDATLTSVIVLRGQALIMHPVILPGMDLTLREVKRKSWRIPQAFQNNESVPYRLRQRAPNHVFVVDDPNKVVGCHNLKEAFSSGVSIEYLENRSFPSTLESLMCIQGKITAIQDIAIKSQSNLKHIHYIILESKMRLYKLYLTYYPISPNCCNGFRVGSFIRAMNVHPLDNSSLRVMKDSNSNGNSYRSFGACLRSTVVLDVCMSEIESSQQISTNVLTFRPLVFRDIQNSYHEYEWISLARKKFSFCGVAAKTVQLTLELIVTDFRCRSRNFASSCCSRRNAYMEWFDHGCEYFYDEDKTLDSKIWSCGLQSDVYNPLPPLLSLSAIKKECLDRASRALTKYLCNDYSNRDSSINFSSHDRANIGWTASINIKGNELIPMSAKGQNYRTTNVFVGGIFNDSSEEGQATISDGKCTIGLSTYYLIESSKTVPFLQNDDFTCILISSVDVTLMYLGEYPGRRHSSDMIEQVKVEFYHLPKMNSNDNLTLEGPSNIIRIGDHFVLVSTIINFHPDKIYALKNMIHPNEMCKQDKHNMSRLLTENLVEMKPDAPRYFRLIRQRWKLQKIQNPFNGCNLTISCSPMSSTYYEPQQQPCSFDISLRIPIGVDIDEHFSIIQGILPKNVLQLALAWQYVAESRISNITLGGWDEKIDVLDTESNLEHLVCMPNDVLQMESKVSRVDVSSLRVRTVKHGEVSWTATSNSLSLPFTYFGGRTMLPGMLDLRVRRVILGEMGRICRFGEAIVPKDLIFGLPSVCLSRLQNSRLSSFNWESTKKFKIPNAQISTIRFCRARAECRRCYSALVMARTKKQQQTWLNNALPINKEEKSFPRTEYRTLECPSGCPARFEYIKWELSANISDGSGSAKVFTERDVAILILGQGLDFDAIEAGAWRTPEGVRYQIGSKLDPELRFDIAKAQNQIRYENLDVAPDTLLTKVKRAQYLLYRHCTGSEEIYRRMDFVCQVKRRAGDEVQHRLYDVQMLSSLGDSGVIQITVDSNFVPFAEFVIVDCFRSFDNVSVCARNLLENLKRSCKN